MEDHIQDIMESCVRDIRTLGEDMKKTIAKATETTKSLRKAADHLDEVWKDCKIAYTAGTSASILGGVLTIGGGIATMMTAGAAAPLLVLGMGFGVAGTVTNLGTSITEHAMNSSIIQKAEKNLKETLDGINEVNNKMQSILNIKDGVKLATLAFFALLAAEQRQMLSESLRRIFLSFASHALDALGNNMPAILQKVTGLLQKALTFVPSGFALVGDCLHIYVPPDLMRKGVQQLTIHLGQGGGQVAGQVGAGVASNLAQAGADVGQGGGQAAVRSGVAEVAGDVAQAGADVRQGGGQVLSSVGDDVVEAGAQAKGASKLFIGLSVAFLVWDAVNLGFTIRDIIQNKGSEAARVLREKADELDQKVIKG